MAVCAHRHLVVNNRDKRLTRNRVGIYRARLPNQGRSGTRLSSARRHFCNCCGSALWVWDPTWPEHIHPHAGAIDTPLPVPPDNVHCLVGSKARWVKIEGGPDDPHFKHYPDMSLAQWHQSKGLTSRVKAGPANAKLKLR